LAKGPNHAIEAIAKGRDRVLLVMATGTGKTYTAFQIIWRLWKAGRKKRILFLADRNVLIDQTMVNDFRPFGAAMAKLSTNAKTIERQDGTTVDLTLALDKKRRIDTAFEVYLGLYQAITGPEERAGPRSDQRQQLEVRRKYVPVRNLRSSKVPLSEKPDYQE
jgi:type I restriction enzyme R subunit